MGGKSNPVVNRVADPYPNTFLLLDSINKQVNLLTANVIGEPQLGTTTTAKKHSSAKVFIIGVIAPSTPTNHIPIKKRFTEASLASAASVTAGGAEARGEGVIEEQEVVDGITLTERETASIMQNKSIQLYSGVTRYEARDPGSVRLKKNVRAADGKRQVIAKAQVDALRAQIEAISWIPPLLMLVNPREFSRNYEQAIDNSPKGRFGHIVHSWLERPMKITASGVTAAQYVIDGGGGGGLTAERRVHSLSYHNLMSLLMTYKNNGVIFAGVEAKAERGIPVATFSLYIYYDNHIYIGSFDDFAIDDRADQPYNMGYSFKFNVRYDMDIDSSHLIESAIFGAQPRTGGAGTTV